MSKSCQIFIYLWKFVENIVYGNISELETSISFLLKLLDLGLAWTTFLSASSTLSMIGMTQNLSVTLFMKSIAKTVMQHTLVKLINICTKGYTNIPNIPDKVIRLYVLISEIFQTIFLLIVYILNVYVDFIHRASTYFDQIYLNKIMNK